MYQNIIITYFYEVQQFRKDSNSLREYLAKSTFVYLLMQLVRDSRSLSTDRFISPLTWESTFLVTHTFLSSRVALKQNILSRIKFVSTRSPVRACTGYCRMYQQRKRRLVPPLSLVHTSLTNRYELMRI
jgi:hypothetical protein